MSARQRRTLQQQVDERRPILESLVGDFSRFVSSFKAYRQFGGPSVYFHLKTIEALSRHPTAADALGADIFFEYLYATLASWGLHRMGPGYTKLGDIGELKASFREQASNIQRVQQLRIDRLDPGKVSDVTKEAWEIMANLRVEMGQTLLTQPAAGAEWRLGGTGITSGALVVNAISSNVPW